MAEGTIFREPTIHERQDFKVVGEKDWKRVCDDKLRDIQQKFTRLHKPFDYPCALIDVHDRVKNLVTEVTRINKNHDKYIKELGIDWEEIEKSYGSESRFEVVGKAKEEKEPSLLNKRVMETVGFTHMYICKTRGHKFAVYIPIQDLEVEGNKLKEKIVEKPKK